jgi:hypothetical protein
LPDAILDLLCKESLKGAQAMGSKDGTTFTSRGRLTGLIRDEIPAAAAQNRASRADRRPGSPTVDEALYYRRPADPR